MDLEKDRARNEADVKEKDMLLSRANGIDGVLKAHNLDAILTPGGAGAGLAARSGYPIIVVPFGMIPNAPATSPLPAGFDAKPAPFGVGFNGAQCTEPRLNSTGLRIRAGDEEARRARKCAVRNEGQIGEVKS